jgi:hypothetical protein
MNVLGLMEVVYWLLGMPPTLAVFITLLLISALIGALIVRLLS